MAKRKSRISKEKRKSDKELKELLACHVQKVRMRRGLTARKVAEDIGITRTALTQMETGKNHFNAVTLYRLASAMRCDIKDLFPMVPDSKSLTEADADEVRIENEEAAKLLKKAFPKK